MIPVDEELELKKAAIHVGEKSLEMLKSKDLLGLTGYVHGGCSPIGMKKFFKTTIHQTALGFDTIIFSGGKIGYQIELSLETLSEVIKFDVGDVTKDRYIESNTNLNLKRNNRAENNDVSTVFFSDVL